MGKQIIKVMKKFCLVNGWFILIILLSRFQQMWADMED